MRLWFYVWADYRFGPKTVANLQRPRTIHFEKKYWVSEKITSGASCCKISTCLQWCQRTVEDALLWRHRKSAMAPCLLLTSTMVVESQKLLVTSTRASLLLSSVFITTGPVQTNWGSSVNKRTRGVNVKVCFCAALIYIPYWAFSTSDSNIFNQYCQCYLLALLMLKWELMFMTDWRKTKRNHLWLWRNLQFINLLLERNLTSWGFKSPILSTWQKNV